jgi:methyl-accepting chemotaxis protein
MGIRARINLGFLLVLGLGTLAAGIGAWNLWGLRAQFADLNGQVLSRERLAHQARAELGDAVHAFKNAVLRGKDYPAQFEAALAGIERDARDYQAIGELAEEERAALAEIAQNLAAYRAAMAGVVELRVRNAAPGDIDKSVAGADRPLAAALARLVAINLERAAQARQAFEARTGQAISELGIAVALMAVLGFIAARRTVADIVQPLAQAARAAQGVAAGDLDQPLETGGSDELAQLRAALADMVGVLKDFAAAQAENARRHDQGALEDQIEAGRFPGVYGEMAGSINRLVQSHVAVKRQVISVVKRYALGDLSVDMDRLPGQKAQVTAAVDEVKASLQSISRQIRVLVNSATNGDFTVRGPVDQYQYEFRDMVAGMNALMEVSDRGLSEVSRVLGALARGDLTQRISGDYRGMFGQLRDDANATVDQLTAMVGRIREAAYAISTASQEIAAGNADLSSRTEEQASGLEETASSMDQLSATVKINADNAQQAHDLVRQSNVVVTRGGESMRRVVTAMSEIQERSRMIADIVGVIDGIAFQTNILALNATVEAARAGEQGRGFAVVAMEVRNLAQRSATAAKEIRALIDVSAEKVEAGAQQVAEAGSAMGEVVGGFDQVTGLMTQIADASREQSGGIGQVNKAMNQMEQVTQHNAALVEEAAAAAESLREQAAGLVEAMALFKLVGEGGRPPKASGRQAPVAPSGGGRYDPPALSPIGHGEDWAEF